MSKIIRLDLLTAIYIFCIVSAELMGSKIIPIFSYGDFRLNASVAIFLVPFIFTINDIITEVYGKERTRSLIRSSLVIIFMVLVVSLFFTALPPAQRFITSEVHYDYVFSKSARIAAASLTAFALAEFLDVFIFVKIRQRLGRSKLWLRTNASNFIAQFIDTVVFMTLAFYAFDLSFQANAAFLLSLIIPYWLLKCFMSVVETPFVYLGIKWLKNDKNYSKS